MTIIIESKIKLFKVKLEVKLEDINILLREKYIHEKHVGVLEGLSGIALFQFYYAKYTNNDKFSDWGKDSLEKIIERINQGYSYPTFSMGLAGAGWVFDHLKNKEFIKLDSDGLLRNVDEFLYNTMIGNIDQGYYDFLHGAMGYAYYFLNRYQSTNNDQLKQKYRNYLEEFIEEAH
jgi:class I lanthipeptide synthase